ncbi:glycoside hydrolase family 97 protein [Pelagicoccus mobilis]|uniref:Glycoside hydrolase family 97 catalytic domain-containing protein n=1 Tax=Pelagicoccus mobilis TaxID=415221 RepID=A0A934S5E9_9BACT|nr:glycoside hydrolase family 97 protein [Pelagicoccus mobilis]MBK1879729.1 glycoside hydrolase family 97 catalytic domain-containing protein [Pelagicoccus mobilis]
MNKLLLPFSLLAVATLCPAAPKSWQVDSPDMRTRIELQLENGKLSYSAAFQKTAPAWQVEASGFQTLIAPSPLGVKTDSEDLSSQLALLSESETLSRSDPYTMLTGKHASLDNHYNERVISFVNKSGTTLEVHIRAYKEGVAFRYGFPGTNGTHTIVAEETGFKLPSNGKKWISHYSPVGTWAPGYEEDYQNGVSIGTPSPKSVGWAFPALFQTEPAWILLTESNLDGNYFAAHLEPDPKDGLYRIRLPETDETYGVHPQTSTAKLPFYSPWRVIMISPDLAGIAENSLVHHLADPCKIEDTSWIKPGPSTWSWLFDHSSQTDYDRLIPFIDLADELDWPYSMVDADWHIMENGNIEQVIEYAAERDVDLTVWYNSGGPTNLVKPIGPADRLHLADTRRKEFAWLQSLGVKGIKVDFLQSDKQGQIQLYIDIIEDAADYELLVFFHGCTLPRGWERTYPNLVSMEAVKGGEQLWSQKFADTIAVHNTILPFTRNVVGSMDYTPFLFQGMGPEITTSTTWAHELATTIVFESGIQHVSETVENFERLPFYVWRFLENLEVAWDETKLLSGHPGENVVIARRKGETWYVAGLNGQDQTLDYSLDLSFLPSGVHSLELIGDGSSKTEFSQSKQLIQKSDKVQITFAPRGGFVATITKR